VDVSGGVNLRTNSDWTFGDAGSISIKAGQDPKLLSVTGGRLKLGASLRGYSGATGGALAIQAPLIQVGTGHSPRGTLVFAPEFFNRGGFTEYSLKGFGAPGDFALQYRPGVVLTAGTVLAPTATSLSVVPSDDHSGGLKLAQTLLPSGQRAPVSLSFGSQGVRDSLTNNLVVRGDVVMEDGSLIRTDPGASVSFTGDTVAILGSIFAPVGSISITGGTDSAKLFTYEPADEKPTPTVYIGSKSVLSAAGAQVLTPDPFGRRVGVVLPGGSIAVAGNIVAARGAVLDVSGTSGVLDFSPFEIDPSATRAIPLNSGLTAPLASLRTIVTRVDSDGGFITLKGGQELFSDATLLGRAGGPTALGGGLSVSSGRFYTTLDTGSAKDTTLIVTQGNRTIPLDPLASLFGTGEQTAIGKPVMKADGTILPGVGHFAADSFLAGGFDSLALDGVVRFNGPVSINARGSMLVAQSGILYADDQVHLSAPYVALGKPAGTPLAPGQTAATPFPANFGPTHGRGVLTVEADLIDIGFLSLQNIRRANFIAANGDIRGAGTLNIAGHLVLEAGQIYTPTAQSFTVVAYDYKNHDFKPGDSLTPGSVTIKASGTRQLPFSAGGTLSFYATNIEQSGVLRAPMGTINLGWDGTGTAPVDLITGGKRVFPVTDKLVLGSHSITSVSAIDPITGEGVLIPYGVSLDGNSWIAPTGADITTGGLPTKNINLAGSRIVTKSSSQIDLRGGGDLYAYRWVPGLGGSRDVLASDTSFAVLPDYQANYAPIGAFSASELATNLIRDPQDVTTRDPGYVNNSLSVGDRIYLGASENLAAGIYTLLPARYALLPGAVLVTPKSGTTIGTLAMADGSSLVSGRLFNDLNRSVTPSGALSQFEVASSEVVRSRAQYDDFLATRFLRDSALANNITPPLLPLDAGHLVFQATESMHLNGTVRGQAPFGGRGAFIDVSSPADIIIAGADANLTKKETKNSIVLKSSLLSSWGAESLLIGGIRQTTDDGTTVTVQTGNLTVDNSGSALSGPEITLVANRSLTIAPGSEIVQSGNLTGHAESLSISGDGALLRVSNDPAAEFLRSGVTSAKDAKMTIGAGARVAGGSITLDSSYATALSPKAVLFGRAVNLNSGQISLLLDDSVELQPTDGLVLAGRALRSLRAARSLSLLSYSSIDVYGAGDVGSEQLENLELHAGQIRGFNNGDVASFRADHVLLDNSSHGVGFASSGASAGSLKIHAQTIELGNRRLTIDQFADVNLNAAGGILLGGKGRLFVEGDLNVNTSAFFAIGGATETIRSTGGLVIQDSGTKPSPSLSSGLGASLTLQGAEVTANSDILLPSGQLSLHATKGDVKVNGRLDVGGTAQTFNDLIKTTGGGDIKLLSDAGNVEIGKRGVLDVAAEKIGGDAGSVSIGAAKGTASLSGTLAGQGEAKGKNGSFLLDVGELPELAKFNSLLDEAAFNESQIFRVRNGNVLINGTATAHNFSVSADKGSILVTGTIDASGATGGTIALAASGSVVLADGSLLDASGLNFSNAGKGGAVTLEAGSQSNGVIDTTALLDLQTGSKIDLSVASANAGSESLGRFTGTLHLRAPQNAASTDLQMAPINGTIKDASSIVVEGYKLFTVAGAAGTISTAVRNNVRNNGIAFVGASGTTTAGYTAMHNRLLANNGGLESVLSIRPGAEIINLTGDVTLGTAFSNATADWDLSTYRFGPKKAPGVLTLRANGNLVFFNELTDGFASNAYNAALLAPNPNLPMNAQSWSYRLAAGADLSAADFHQVRALNSLAAGSGSLLLGKDNGVNSSNSNGSANAPGKSALTFFATQNRFQVIRTGSGDIDISAGRDVQLLNQFATIYTAGTRIADPTLNGTFVLPNLTDNSSPLGPLGTKQQDVPYPVQFTLGGGNVSIFAQGDIAHYTRNLDGNLIADSGRQLPLNWLYRRGYVDPASGEFGNSFRGEVASTAWWVDFSNFFEGIGALGGGDVTMVAGGNISNVDAAVPTNARMPEGKPDATKLVELGGGDLVVRAGHDIDAGVYYVERGHGTLSAGNAITTNSTRSPSLGNLAVLEPDFRDASTWLPTTLFVGKASFDVNARGDILLGPVANLFLMPGSRNVPQQYRSYFSTYSPTAAVNVSSLGGSVTLREQSTQDGASSVPLLETWLQDVLFLRDEKSVSWYQPWLRLNESAVDAFSTVTALLPPTLRATAFSGDINLVGNVVLTPAPRGTIELAAAGSINGLQPNGVVTVGEVTTTSWGTSTINLSDANPNILPGVTSPFAIQSLFASADQITLDVDADFLDFINQSFAETGATDSVLQTKQALHAPTLLHADDSSPVRLYAQGGDISGLTLFSPKAARIVAGQDVTDIAFYIQNLDADDVSVVAAGRDIVAYNSSSPLRSAAQTAGNKLNFVDQLPRAGDIQV
ncbi:MAG: hypothetical protein ACREKL_15365, partial [Chthoniobacterales bacterium]